MYFLCCFSCVSWCELFYLGNHIPGEVLRHLPTSEFPSVADPGPRPTDDHWCLGVSPTSHEPNSCLQSIATATNWKISLPVNEPRREKTVFFAYAKKKTQISFAVTAKLVNAFVFAT